MVDYHHQVESGSLTILPERDSCLPGEALTGVVMLHLTRPLANTTLSIALIGHEHMYGTFTDDEGDKSKTSGRHGLTNQRVILSEGPLAAGDLCVPFVIPVPHALPPTKHAEYASEMKRYMYASEVSCLQIQISYSLQCQLTVRDASERSITHEIPTTVSAWPDVRPVGEPITAEAARTFRYDWFTKKGACAVRAMVLSNVVSVGAFLTARVWLTIAPRERLRAVHLSLVRKIVPHTKSMRDHKYATQVLCTRSVDRSVLGDCDDLVLELPVNEASAPVVDGKCKLQPFHPSETFHHFSVTYEVLVECKVRSCETVEVRIPVSFVPAGGAAADAPSASG